jgi:hypothetical protein
MLRRDRAFGKAPINARRVYYWNKQNFEGLTELSQELTRHPNLDLLAQYCTFREQGLRREAFSTLERFLVAAQSFDSLTARSAALNILELNARAVKVHQFLTQPLITRFLTPTLEAWIRAEPETSAPVRWLGILAHDDALLDKALAMRPEDTPVRKLLIKRDLSWAEFATHHLDESHFIGDVDETVAALERARSLIVTAPDPEKLSALEAEVRYLDDLVADWKVYRENVVGTFSEWCAKRGRMYRFPTHVYYEKP